MYYTWKSIGGSDYSIRTFKAYKNWSLSSNTGILLLSASGNIPYNESNTIQITDNFFYNPKTLHSQLSSSFYTSIDTPIVEGIRKLQNRAKVFSIPTQYLGEGIRPGTLTITDTPNNVVYTDNTSGSLVSGSPQVVVGDIFYTQGIVVYTDMSSMDNVLNGTWKVGFKSTRTITEHEIFVGVDNTEFNISRNPTALYTTNQIWYELPESNNQRKSLVMTRSGEQYIRKKSTLVGGTEINFGYGSKVITGVSGGFEQYSESSSIDTTGSFLTPFVTSIGLYDSESTLIAIAKLPRPIKNEPGLPINFIVRFDV